MNQRAMGVNRTVIRDSSTGKSQVIYESRRTALSVFLTILGQIIAIAVIMFSVVKFGVRHESEQVIRKEIKAPDGLIHQSIERCIRESVEPIKTQVITIDVRQQEIGKDVKEIKEMIRNGSK